MRLCRGVETERVEETFAGATAGSVVVAVLLREGRRAGNAGRALRRALTTVLSRDNDRVLSREKADELGACRVSGVSSTARLYAEHALTAAFSPCPLESAQQDRQTTVIERMMRLSVACLVLRQSEGGKQPAIDRKYGI